MKILYYISGHGLGHATREVAIMSSLLRKDPETQIFARTKVNESLFSKFPKDAFHHFYTSIDVGVVERDIFSQDIAATLEQYEKIIETKDSIVNRELTFCRNERIDLIVSDIPPLASEIGAAGNIPSIAIGNFSWDFIYEPYVNAYPRFKRVIEEIQSQYRKTNLLLRLPLHHEMTAFPTQQDIPLAVRRPTAIGLNVRRKLGLKDGDPRRIVLVALRTQNTVPAAAIQRIVENREFILLSFTQLSDVSDENIRILGADWPQEEFPNIVAGCDIVISKLGYGIVSECIAGKTGLMYIPRYDFAEYDILRSGMKNLLHSYLLPSSDFLQGNWGEHLRQFQQEPFQWTDVPLEGADAAADQILSFAR